MTPKAHTTTAERHDAAVRRNAKIVEVDDGLAREILVTIEAQSTFKRDALIRWIAEAWLEAEPILYLVRRSKDHALARKGVQVPNCTHYDICGLNDQADRNAGLCILHSQNESKDRFEFQEALQQRIRRYDYNFAYFVFPFPEDFTRGFDRPASFRKARFVGPVNFGGATFGGSADFRNAEFHVEANS